MADRTISRDANNSRVVLVWPAGVDVDDVKPGLNSADYAIDNFDGTIVQPAQIPTDVFKAAFGFIPLTGSKAKYTLAKTVAPETLEQKLTSAIKDLVRDVLAADG